MTSDQKHQNKLERQDFIIGILKGGAAQRAAILKDVSILYTCDVQTVANDLKLLVNDGEIYMHNKFYSLNPQESSLPDVDETWKKAKPPDRFDMPKQHPFSALFVDQRPKYE